MPASLLFSLGAALTVQATPAPVSVSEDDVLMTADRIYRESEDGPLVAEGDVRAVSEGRFVRADRIIYDVERNLVTAIGGVAVRDEDGQIYFAEEAVLSSDLKNAIVDAFTAEFSPRGTLAAASAVRRGSGVNDLRKATFTLCDVCEEGFRRDRPTWQLKSRKVVQDEDKKVLRFRDAFVELYGVPFLYTPYAQIPDPSVERATGLLAPQIRSSTLRGTEIEVPFYVVISNTQDFTFSPRHYSLLGTLFKGEWRQNTPRSQSIVQAGVINPTNDLDEEPGDPDDVRWHWFSRYRRELPADWTMVADIDGVSDKGYVTIYDIEPTGELQESIPILRPDRLESNLSFTRKTERSSTDLSGWLFQTLRANEDQQFTAQALPRLRHDQFYDFAGGTMTIGGSVLNLVREDGLNSFRGSAHMRYSAVKLTRSGHRFEAFGELRGDYYAYRDADRGIQACNEADPFFDTCRQFLPRNAEQEAYDYTRILPTIGAEWSYPLARIGSFTSFIIEPRIQAVASPTKSFTDDVFNEDSQFFQFDDVTLFDYNKATGLDRWEDGQRVNIGLSGTAAIGSKITIDTMIGSQFRSESTDAFGPNTGIGEVQSDVVGAVDVRLGSNLTIDNRFRIDDDTGSFRRVESLVNARLGPISGNVNYLRVESDEFEEDQILDEFLTATAAVQLTRNISFAATQAQNLDSGQTTQTNFALRIANECAALSIRYRFDDSNVQGFETDRQITFQFDIIGFN